MKYDIMHCKAITSNRVIKKIGDIYTLLQCRSNIKIVFSYSLQKTVTLQMFDDVFKRLTVWIKQLVTLTNQKASPIWRCVRRWISWYQRIRDRYFITIQIIQWRYVEHYFCFGYIYGFTYAIHLSLKIYFSPSKQGT